MIDIKYDLTTIDEKRMVVREALFRESSNIKSCKIDRISNDDLFILFKQYNEVFLNDWFTKKFPGKMQFNLSRHMTRSAGITKCPKNYNAKKPHENSITICIGVDFFLKYDYLEGSKMVCGLETHNSLEALQMVFEHELIHAIEFILFQKSSCKKNRFKDTVRNIFGHTKSHHQIPTNSIIASKKYGINIGDRVQFQFENAHLVGFIAKINKRAVVMVRDRRGQFIDKQGVRYRKYYVPLGLLIK